MTSAIIRQDDQCTLSLSTTCKQILKDKNPFTFGISTVSIIAQQIIFSNHVALGYELFVAVAEFDAGWTDANPSWKPAGLNQSKLGITAECFFESHPQFKRPPKERIPLDFYGRNELNHNRKYLFGHTAEFCQLWLNFEQNRYPHVEIDTSDPHSRQWTDDPLTIGYCFYSLIQTPELEMKPSTEACKEALQAALKLYTQPHCHQRKRTGLPGQFVHYELIPRTLAVSIAIQAGELDAAADILELATSIDGLNFTGTTGFLQIPGIYDVLPIYALRGVEANKYYISESDASDIVQQLKMAMQDRLSAVRPDPTVEISWKAILGRLAKAAWKVHGKSYRRAGLESEQDILFPPATEEEICEAEQRVGKLPDDLKEMVRVSNGFKGGWHFLNGGIASITNISCENSVKYWLNTLQLEGVRTNFRGDGKIIVISPGTDCDGYIHYLIPPETWKKVTKKKKLMKGEYLFFQWSTWDNNSDEDDMSCSVKAWVVSCLEMLEVMVENGETDEDEDLEENKGDDKDENGGEDGGNDNASGAAED